MDKIDIRKDTYFDSVFLMAASARLARIEGLEQGHLVLATPQNLALLMGQGFDATTLQSLGPTDLVLALRAGQTATLEQASAMAADLLVARSAPGSDGDAPSPPVGLEGGLARLTDANLALISVPGEYAAFEARKALSRGLHVMIFSNNVPLEQEVALKRRAQELGLLVMGPDCGTAMIAGMPLGFANRIRPGCIGLVGASGTGLQEVSCQIHRLGSGVTHILGTGGHDLSSAVGAMTTLEGVKLLAQDPATRVLVVVSKPPAREVAERVVFSLARLDKPSVVCFLGQQSAESDLEDRGRLVHHAGSLTETAWLAHRLSTGDSITTTLPFHTLRMDELLLVKGMAPSQRNLWGLFTGGTLGGESLLILRTHLGRDRVRSNLSAPDATDADDGHTLLDLGDDVYTRDRPHPMIDPTPRCKQILQHGGNPRTALLLLDLVLGSGCHPDPAAAAADAIITARETNPGLVVVASITGTELDPQGLVAQQRTLEQAGVQVLPGNAAAASFAARLIQALEEARS